MSYPHRWVMYCKNLGVAPEKYKPVSNAEFITWVNLKLREYKLEFGTSQRIDADRFDKWLSERVSGKYDNDEKINRR